MNLCETCVHWTPCDRDKEPLPGLGSCSGVPEYMRAVDWDTRRPRRLFLKPEFADKLALVEDGEEYYAALRTFPNFGCVMHKSKEEE